VCHFHKYCNILEEKEKNDLKNKNNMLNIHIINIKMTSHIQGTIGYVIGRKKRLMHVKEDADLLWQILVREIYVLMKHYKTKEDLRDAFDTIAYTRTKPKPEDIEKCKLFTDFEKPRSSLNDWPVILRYCQSSFINMLESGYIIGENLEIGKVLILDFNKWLVKYYTKDLNGNITEHNAATIDEIMSFAEMPIKTYEEIISEMREKFDKFYSKLIRVNTEIEKITSIIDKAKQQNSQNIADQASKLLNEMKTERQKLLKKRRVFYHRLKALDLIEETTEETLTL
jgi:hypothetical protein